MKEFDPEIKDWDRVRAVYALHGREVDFPKERELEILAAFEKKAEEDGFSETWECLQLIAIQKGDLALMERSLKALHELRGSGQSRLATLYFADRRFDEAADVMSEILEENPNRIDILPYLTISLEVAGRKEEAAARMLQFEKLALGDGSWMVTLGYLWGQIGNYEREYGFYQRALLQLPTDSEQWLDKVRLLADCAYRSRKWKQSAAFGEVASVRTNGESRGAPVLLIRARAYIEFARAMSAFNEGDEASGERWFTRMVERSQCESFYADDIFPELRIAGLHQQAEELWEAMAPNYRHSMKLFPKAHNSYNTAAWVAARVGCNLEEAASWVDIALEGRPGASAYLDTKAEVLFAKGQRAEALKWSEKACKSSESVRDLIMLRQQFQHFKDDPFPLAGVEEAE